MRDGRVTLVTVLNARRSALPLSTLSNRRPREAPADLGLVSNTEADTAVGGDNW